MKKLSIGVTVDSLNVWGGISNTASKIAAGAASSNVQTLLERNIKSIGSNLGLFEPEPIWGSMLPTEVDYLGAHGILIKDLLDTVAYPYVRAEDDVELGATDVLHMLYQTMGTREGRRQIKRDVMEKNDTPFVNYVALY